MNIHRPEGTVRAVLDLSIEAGADDTSRMRRNRVTYPWSLGRGYPGGRGGRTITVIPQVAGAGLLAGDRFHQSVTVAEGAALKLVSAGATLVHGGALGGTTSSWRFDLAHGAQASVASEPHVLMGTASLALRQELVIDAGAVFVGCEAFALAEGAAGAGWTSETTARRPDGTILFQDRQAAPAVALARVRALPGQSGVFGSVLALGPADNIAGLLRHLKARLVQYDRVLTAAAPLCNEAGVGVRLAAREAGRLRHALLDLQASAAGFLGI